MNRVTPALAVIAVVLVSTPVLAQSDPRWMARAHLGIRTVAPSAEEDLLSEDGYGTTVRLALAADYARRFTSVLGGGTWGEFTYRASSGQGDGPTFDEFVLAGGVGIPVWPLGWDDSATLMFVPRLGYGVSWMSIGGRARPNGGVAYGIDVSLMFPRIHMSITLGWLDGPTGRPGDVGRASNFGGFGLLFGGLIDG